MISMSRGDAKHSARYSGRYVPGGGKTPSCDHGGTQKLDERKHAREWSWKVKARA